VVNIRKGTEGKKGKRSEGIHHVLGENERLPWLPQGEAVLPILCSLLLQIEVCPNDIFIERDSGQWMASPE
jgi:hypothetical protein